MNYHFDWDTNKNSSNIQKHGVSFSQAVYVLNDPNQLSVFDEKHSIDEDRWITLGIDRNGILRVLVHTFNQLDPENVEIRVISARSATSQESKVYSERP